MKKLLPWVLIASLSCLSPNVAESKLEKKVNSKDYSYELLYGFFKIPVGEVSYSKDELNFSLKKVDELMFKKYNDSTYYEVAVSPDKKEVYKYSFDKIDSLWKFANYWAVYFDEDGNKIKNPDESLMRQDKIQALGDSYDKDVFLATDIFNQFEGNTIPKELNFVVFGYKYNAKLVGKPHKGRVDEVKYDITNYKEYETDTRKLENPISIFLETESDGTYSPVGAKIMMENKGFFGKSTLWVIRK